MAPEQARGLEVDHRIDLYAVGVCLFEMLAGRRPHVAATSGELLALVTSQRAPPLLSVAPDVDPRLASAVDRALSFDPLARPKSALEMLELLSPWSRSDSTMSSSPDLPTVRGSGTALLPPIGTTSITVSGSHASLSGPQAFASSSPPVTLGATSGPPYATGGPSPRFSETAPYAGGTHAAARSVPAGRPPSRPSSGQFGLIVAGVVGLVVVCGALAIGLLFALRTRSQTSGGSARTPRSKPPKGCYRALSFGDNTVGPGVAPRATLKAKDGRGITGLVEGDLLVGAIEDGARSPLVGVSVSRKEILWRQPGAEKVDPLWGPVLDLVDGRAYVMRTNDGRSRFDCVDARTGGLSWSLPLADHDFGVRGIKVRGGKVFLNGGEGVAIVDIANGTVIRRMPRHGH